MRAAGAARRDDPAAVDRCRGRSARSRRVVGYAIADHVAATLKAAIDGFAAGALLVMLIDSMIPEAVRKGGDVAGLVTVLGFAVATAI